MDEKLLDNQTLDLEIPLIPLNEKGHEYSSENPSGIETPQFKTIKEK